LLRSRASLKNGSASASQRPLPLTAKDTAAAAKFDALIQAAKKLQSTMAVYVDDWAAFNAALDVAVDGQKNRPSVRADIAPEHPFTMVQWEMTRAACNRGSHCLLELPRAGGPSVAPLILYH
jgi:hypothetical protein